MKIVEMVDAELSVRSLIREIESTMTTTVSEVYNESMRVGSLAVNRIAFIEC